MKCSSGMTRLKFWIKVARKGYGRGRYVTNNCMVVMQSETSRGKGERAGIKRWTASQVMVDAQNNYNYMWELWRSMQLPDPLISFARTMRDSLGRTIQVPKVHRSKFMSWLKSLLEVRAVIPSAGRRLAIGSSCSKVIGAERRGECNRPPSNWQPYKGGNVCKLVFLLLLEIECRRLPSRGLATEKKKKQKVGDVFLVMHL
eukprot:c25702_g1_i2 orf=171-773(+)